MPDRRRRTAFRFPLPQRSALLMRERQSSSPDSGSAGKSPDSGSAGKPQEDNPFAAPPADRPDQPWQPRRPSGSQGQGSDEQDDNGSGSGSGGDRPAWGSQWSDRQPGRGSGGFGGGPGGNGAGGPGGKGGNGRSPGGLRWDPTDPAQRRARYAVLGGMWAFFFALFDFPEIALLLGALATYWAISALRTPLKNASATDRTAVDGGSAATAAPGAPANPAAPAPPSNVSSRQQTTAAVGGLVTALLALLIVATSYTVQLVYRDYYTCVDDALTKSASVACNDKLPKPLEPFFGVKE
ncbi:hypothetical protein JHN55_18125 [Streptomyces sp. MBT56]|uniref:hypothetical protein n=1 Tax=unclassified Streptomyces TaxID=2593676 RepID=UPI00190AA62D|nr:MULTISPECIES: hypothetical protein [unclassified Streptomyces]MBK3558414.1 hypothetical protein [Streptomyces sp. MBT56]MBK3606917.1 hypothetical protein [Streptomyces sp. MBT54]MBK3619983.1 hypothetical protein [Streptomyces sp. MBT98]MBK6047520.1 hypothetical protein [Streptomyces sp. MBT55]